MGWIYINGERVHTSNIQSLQVKYINNLVEILSTELHKNGYNYTIDKFESYDEPEYHEVYYVTFIDGFQNKRILKFLASEKYILVSYNGDGNSFYEIKNKDYSIKHFWIALLT